MGTGLSSECGLSKTSSLLLSLSFPEISTPKYPKLNSLVLKNEVYFCTHLPSFEQPCLAILRVWLQPWELFCTEISPFSALL